MTDVAFIIGAALAKAKLALAIEKVNRFPSGTPGGKGGQFAPTQGGGGFGGKAELPATAKPHPKKGEKGDDVIVHYPSRAGDPAAWGKADSVATAVPGGPVPDALHGIPFASWKPPADWSKVSGTNPKIDEDEPFDYAPEQRPGSGVVIVEPDGRMWITKPTNGFGGYVHSWPKGGLEDGLNLQQNAIKEAWEETGLKVKITGLLGDYDGDTSKARYYVAQRVGGTPADMGWETQAMRLVPASKLKTLLNRSRDKDIADHITELLKIEGIAKAKGKTGAGQQPRWPAGSPLGGQWKGYDGGGVAMPPKIAGGLEGKNTAYQKQVNMLYAAFKDGDVKLVSNAASKLKEKVDANAAKGAKSSHVKWTAQVHQYAESLLNTGQNQAKAEAAATVINGPEKITGWKFLKDKSVIGGSAPGGLYEAKGGGTYLVKGNASKALTGPQVSDDRAKNEILASKLLTAVGAGSPDMKLVDLGDKHGGGLGVATKWMDGLTKFNSGNKAHLAAAQSQFAIHAWLGNYDVIGASFDNTMITKDGKALCIDPGGSILFRAMGKKKDAGAFGPIAKEMESLRDPKVNANAAAVYGSMTKSQLQASADMLKNINDDTIKSLVKAHGPGDQKAKDSLAQTLIDRKNNILAKYGTQAPKPKAEAPKAPAKPKPAPVDPRATPSPKPTKVEGFPPPKFSTGFKSVDAVYNSSVKHIQELHAKASVGDKDAMAEMITAAQNLVQQQKITPGGGKTPQKVATGPNQDKMKSFVAGMLGDAAAKYYAITEAAKGEQAKISAELKAAADAKVKAEKTALPNFAAAKIPDSNTNAKSHNAKVDLIAEMAGKGDVTGILSLKYGTNTYGKKQAQLANDTLAALGSSSKVAAGQSTGTNPEIKAGEKPKVAPKVKQSDFAKPTPESIKGKIDLPRPDFINWHGPGKGLSSQPAKNQANQAAVDKIAAVAKAADLPALKALTYEEIDPATGAKTGKLKLFSEHPSKHVQSFYADAVQALDSALNPPRPIKLVDVGSFKNPSAIAEHFKAKSLGTTVDSVSKSQKFGFWIALGGVTETAPFKPKSTFDMGGKTISDGYDQFKTFSKNTKSFIKLMQGSGQFADAYRNGNDTYQGADLKSLYQSAKKDAIKYAEGTSIYRWQNMPKQMIKQIMDTPDGVIYQATGPMPHSHDPLATKGFGKHRVKVMFAEGAKALPSFGSGAFAGEKEVTTLPRARFMVLSKKWVPDVEHGNSKEMRLEIEVLMLPHADED